MDKSNLSVRPDGHLALVGQAVIESAIKKLNEALALVDIAGVPVAGAHIQKALELLPLYLLNDIHQNS